MPSNCGAGKDLLKSSLDRNESKLVNPKGKQPWISTERTGAEAEAPIVWPPDAKSLLTGKDSDAGKDWGQNEKGATENEMVGWHHQLNGHEFDRKTWCAKVHGVAKIWMGLSDWTTNSKTILWILHYTTYLLSSFFFKAKSMKYFILIFLPKMFQTKYNWEKIMETVFIVSFKE